MKNVSSITQTTKHTTITCVSITSTILLSYCAAIAVVFIFVISEIVDQAKTRILNDKRVIREENKSTSLPDCTSLQNIIEYTRVSYEGKLVTKEIL